MSAVALLQGIPVLVMLAAGIWALRLEGRVSMHEAVCAERYKRLEERHDESIEALKQMNSKIDLFIIVRNNDVT